MQADEHKKIDFQVQYGVNIDMSAAGPHLASVATVRLVVLHTRERSDVVHSRMVRAKLQCGQLQYNHMAARIFGPSCCYFIHKL